MVQDSPVHDVTASVLCMRVPKFAGLQVVEQVSQLQRVREAAAAAATMWAQPDRIILDSPDGAVIVGLQHHVRAFAAARQVAASNANLAMGLHHGPVHATQDQEGRIQVAGDGIAFACALAQDAAEGAIHASQAFKQALAADSPREADALVRAGTKSDPQLGVMELFVFHPVAGQARQRRRSMIGAAAFAGIFGVGALVRLGRERSKAAGLVLHIRPAGEVFVDGEFKGSTPPLVRLAVKPGDHAIEVRNSGFKPLKLQVRLSPGEEMRVQHEFDAGPVRAGSSIRKPRVIERLNAWLESL